MRAGRFRGEKKVKNGFYLQRAVNNSRKAFLRVHDFAGLQTIAHFGGSRGVPADGPRGLVVPAGGARMAYGWRAGARRWRAGRRQMVRGSANGSWAEAGRWPADGMLGRQVAGGWRAGTGGAGGWRAAIVFSSLELTYFGKRNIYQAKWACGS